MRFCVILGSGSGLGAVSAPCLGGGAQRQPKGAQNGGSEALLRPILGTLRLPWQPFGPTLGAIEVTWGSLWVPLGSFGITLDDSLAK